MSDFDRCAKFVRIKYHAACIDEVFYLACIKCASHVQNRNFRKEFKPRETTYKNFRVNYGGGGGFKKNFTADISFAFFFYDNCFSNLRQSLTYHVARGGGFDKKPRTGWEDGVR